MKKSGKKKNGGKKKKSGKKKNGSNAEYNMTKHFFAVLITGLKLLEEGENQWLELLQ